MTPATVALSQKNVSVPINASSFSEWAGKESKGKITVLQDWKGGSGTANLGEWRQSLQAKPNANWKVIDRYQDKCIPHWYWVGDNPVLAHTLCRTYETMQEVHRVPYVLKRPNVQCSKSAIEAAIQANGTDVTIATVQPSLRACAAHVHAKHGHAFFIYRSKPDVVATSRSKRHGKGLHNDADEETLQENLDMEDATIEEAYDHNGTHGKWNDSNVEALEGNDEDEDEHEDEASEGEQHREHQESAEGCTIHVHHSGVSQYNGKYTLDLDYKGIRHGVMGWQKVGDKKYTLQGPISWNGKPTWGLCVNYGNFDYYIKSSDLLPPADGWTMDNDKTDGNGKKPLPRVIASPGCYTVAARSDERRKVKAGKENCVALKTLDGCQAASSGDAPWNLYRARGVSPSLCGVEPPGYSMQLHKNGACPKGKYQVKDGYPGGVCASCFDACPEGSFLEDCGGANPGRCVPCSNSCGLGSFQADCGKLSPGTCKPCISPSGPFKSFDKSHLPCKFSCYPPAVAQGMTSCEVSRCGKKGCEIAAKNNSRLSWGTCEGEQWKSVVLTKEAHCGDKFRPIRLKLEYVGPGNDARGQWHLTDADTANRLSFVDKQLTYEDTSTENSTAPSLFTFVPTSHEAYHLVLAGTGECVKAVKKPGFQLSSCCCDEFALVE